MEKSEIIIDYTEVLQLLSMVVGVNVTQDNVKFVEDKQYKKSRMYIHINVRRGLEDIDFYNRKKLLIRLAKNEGLKLLEVDKKVIGEHASNIVLNEYNKTGDNNSS